MELSRRRFLAGLGGVGGLAATGALVGCSDDDTASTPGTIALEANPFTLGVASGDPDTTSVVLWTRLALDPLAPNGGMPDEDIAVEVVLEGADTRSDRRSAVAKLADGHTVHAIVDDLTPGTDFTYWFRAGDHVSPRGTARTLPAAGDRIDEFTIAQVSCARWDEAEFAAYRDLARSRPDLVVHCGDYIYERPVGEEDRVRDGAITAETLEDYRFLYALYRTDPSLQAAHAAAPWVVTWDDHEVSNNYVSDQPDAGSESPDPAALLARREAAYRAWWENMPVRTGPPGRTRPGHLPDGHRR